HIVCALLVFGIVRSTLELSARTWGSPSGGPIRPTWGPPSGGPIRLKPDPTDVAFWTALISVVHPLNTEAVDYLIQRTESMMALCYLLTLYASIRALRSRTPAAWYIVAVTSCGLGMGCKESMAPAPLMVVAYDRTYVFSSFRRAVGNRWRLYAGLSATWLLLAALLWSGPRSNTAGFLSNDD